MEGKQQRTKVVEFPKKRQFFWAALGRNWNQKNKQLILAVGDSESGRQFIPCNLLYSDCDLNLIGNLRGTGGAPSLLDSELRLALAPLYLRMRPVEDVRQVLGR